MPVHSEIKPREFSWRILVFFSLIAVPGEAPRLVSAGSGKTEVHPIVAGYERFFAKNRNASASGGQLLLGELNCTSCHKADPAQEPFLLRRQAPILDQVADRVRIGYLRK